MVKYLKPNKKRLKCNNNFKLNFIFETQLKYVNYNLMWILCCSESEQKYYVGQRNTNVPNEKKNENTAKLDEIYQNVT